MYEQSYAFSELSDNAENVNAWTSLHRVQQFRFFGIHGRQEYRELRLLAGQAARAQGDKKAGRAGTGKPASGCCAGRS